MNINPDYMAVMRTGAQVTRSQFRKEQDAWHIIFIFLVVSALVILIAVVLI